MWCFYTFQWLDGTAIGRAERIQALQGLSDLRRRILQQEVEYVDKREKQKMNGQKDNSFHNPEDLDHENVCSSL